MDMGHDHGGHSMSMAMPNATATATAAMASGSAAAAGGGGGHGGMSMGGSCKISMLWNWNTVDTCFLSKSWHNTTKSMYAGSVVGVFFLCFFLEGVRRAGREYDRQLTARGLSEKRRFEPSWLQHLVRTGVYGVQFTAAFLVMLLGMYYNGGILFAIFFGHTIGYFVFGKDTVKEQQTDSGCAC